VFIRFTAETLAEVAVDLSNRPYLVYNLPRETGLCGSFDTRDIIEFFRALTVKAGMNLHINVRYGDNDHHIIESIFKHGLVGAKKARELGIEIFRGGDADSLGEGKGYLCATASELLDFKEFQKADDDRLGWYSLERSKQNYTESYFPNTVKDILNGELQRSPVTILGERKFTHLSEEIRESGKEEVQERLRSGIFILMSTNEKPDQWRTNPNMAKVGQRLAYGFPELPLDSTEAIFVPEGLFNLVRDNTPWRFRGKIKKIIGEISPQDGNLYDYEIAGNKLKIPDWYPAVYKYLSHAKLNKTFLMHAVRFPTSAEIQTLHK